MLPESLNTSRVFPPGLIGIAAAIKGARDAIAVYEGLRIIGSEITGEPGSIRSMIASPNRGPALTVEGIGNMTDFELVNSISIDDPFDETSLPSDMTGTEVVEMISNANAEETAGRLALNEIERRFQEGPSGRQQEIIDAMQARQQATENDEQAVRNQQRAEAFNRTTRNAFNALGDLGAAFFGRARKSSDSALVSMERHEYEYCCNSPLKIFSLISNATSEGGTYINAIFHALDAMLQRAIDGEADSEGNTLSFDPSNNVLLGVSNFQELQSALTLTHGASGDSGTNASNFFTYGNWVDSRFMRKGIALVRRLVRTVRSSNVTEILRLTTGETPPEFFIRLLNNLNYPQLANALREFIVIDMDVDGGVNALSDDPNVGFFFTVNPPSGN